MSEVWYAAAVKPLTYRMPAKFRIGGWHVCSWALLNLKNQGFQTYCRQAITEAERPERAQLAEGAPTQAVKARLLDEAVYWDQLAADADRRAGKPAGS